ncbi:hypothetical protein LY76DRAFT_114133 [Colletotrichum caudatum]|nr:hypothetical protein LY76DRAFT_114133 [Colletotrichum caudatum]
MSSRQTPSKLLLPLLAPVSGSVLENRGSQVQGVIIYLTSIAVTRSSDDISLAGHFGHFVLSIGYNFFCPSHRN